MGEASIGVASEAKVGEERRPARWRRRVYLLGQVLATLGVLGYALFAWMPWSSVTGFTVTDAGGQTTNYTLQLSPARLDLTFGLFAWSAMSIVGLLVLPLVWSRFRGLAPFVFLAFALFVGVTPSWADNGMYARHDIILGPTMHPDYLALYSPPKQLDPYWLALVSLLLIMCAALLLLFAVVAPARSVTAERWERTPRGAPDTSRTVPIHLTGAGALTAGLLLLLASVFLVGWAGDNCTATPLLASTCTGLSFNGVEYYGILTHTDLFDPIASLHAIPLLLAGGAALILLALWWRRRVTPSLCLWITLYLAAATFFCVVALAGVGAVSDHAATLGLQAGTWRGQTGAYIAGAGLLVAWLALVSLWYAAVRRRDTVAGDAAAA